MNDLLDKVKANLILYHNEDDELIRGYINAAICYAESYQKMNSGYYLNNEMSQTTEQAVIMLATHFYESRDVFGAIMCKRQSKFGVRLIGFYSLIKIGRFKIMYNVQGTMYNESGRLCRH